MIDSQDERPAWRQVADDLLERVESGECPPGSRLRAEVDLAHDWGVGKHVIRQALRHLAVDGVLFLQAGFRALVRKREHRVVVMPRGAVLTIRHPTRKEQRDMQLNASAFVGEITLGERTPEVYEVPLTQFKASS